MFPGFVIGEHRVASCSRHRAQAVTQQVNAGSERREFFAAAVDFRSGFHWLCSSLCPPWLNGFSENKPQGTQRRRSRPTRESVKAFSPSPLDPCAGFPSRVLLLPQSADRSSLRECAAESHPRQT